MTTTTPSLASKERLLTRARKVIPGCSQAFSKGADQYPQSVNPHYLVRGQGARVEDADGNRYLDFTMGLCPVILGYADSDINEAVQEQLAEGTIFTLSHPVINSAIIGTTNAAHARENARRAQASPLSPQLLDALHDLRPED